MGAQQVSSCRKPEQAAAATRVEFERGALAQAHQIVQQEGAAFAVATRDRDLATIQATGTTLAEAIAKAIVGAYEAGRVEG
jgi:hypothetical protein